MPCKRNLCLPIFVLSLAILCAPSPSVAQQASALSCTPLKTGLVLSGGGAKGFAHVGVFKILDSLHIKPDFIVGSSIGAITGAMYASGYTGQEIDSIARKLPISNVIRSYSPLAPGVIGALPAFAVWENNGRGFTLQTGAVREGEVNALMSALMLRGNLIARGDFDRLPIPLRVIGTKLSTRKAVVLSKGDLAQAVRASFAIPLIFAPGVIGGDVLMDGGVADNIPVATARAMGAERLIVSTLPSATVSDELFGDPMKVALQLTDYLFLNDTTTFRQQDLIIRNRTADFNPLDFSPATLDSLVRSGMQVARETFAKAGCVQTLRGAAEQTREVRVPTVVSEIQVNSKRRLEGKTMRFALGVRPGRRFNEDSLRQRLLQLGEADDYRAIWLMPSGRDSSVKFNVTPVYGAKQAIVVGLAYDNDLGGRLWGGMAWRDLFNAAVEGAVALDIGKYRQEFRGGLLRRIPAMQRAAPLVASFRSVSEDIRIFTDSGERNPVFTRSLELAVGVSGQLPGGFAIGITPIVRLWRVAGTAAVGAAGLNVRMADGVRIVDARTVLEGEVNSRYQRVHFDGKHAWDLGTVEVVPRLRVGWSRNAPLQEQFFLGGYDGFGGLRTTQRRGEQEAMAGLALKRPLFGPIRASGEVTVGAIGVGNGFLTRQLGTVYGQVITGWRVGGEIRTAVLDVHVERGFNSVHGDIWFFRLGQWF